MGVFDAASDEDEASELSGWSRRRWEAGQAAAAYCPPLGRTPSSHHRLQAGGGGASWMYSARRSCCVIGVRCSVQDPIRRRACSSSPAVARPKTDPINLIYGNCLLATSIVSRLDSIDMNIISPTIPSIYLPLIFIYICRQSPSFIVVSKSESL